MQNNYLKYLNKVREKIENSLNKTNELFKLIWSSEKMIVPKYLSSNKVFYGKFPIIISEINDYESKEESHYVIYCNPIFFKD